MKTIVQATTLLVSLLVGAARSSSAVAGVQPVVVVEAHDGARPPDANTVLAPVYAELAKRGYVGGDKLAEMVRSRVSEDPGSLTPSQVVEAQQAVERAYGRFIDGNYSEALASAEKALALYTSAPGVLAREEAVRALEFKALIIAARSAQVLGRNDDAFRWMAEAIRSFAPQGPSSAEFDPSVLALYRRVNGELKRQGGGTLAVDVSDPAVTIFIDERFVGSGHVKLDDVLPGRYRVLVAKGSQVGRVHMVDVAPHGKASVDVAWNLDAALSTGAGYVALTADGDDLGGASQVARALDAPRVVVLSIRSVAGRRAVVGYAIDVESQRRSYAAVQIEPLPPPEETLRRLAALLAGDEDVSTSDLITREPSTVVSHPFGARRKVALAVGIAALIAGGVAIGFDVSAHNTYDASTREPDDARQQSLFDSSNDKYHLAQGLAVVGVVGIAAAATLWFTAPKESEGVEVAPVASGNELGLVVSGRF